MTKNQKDKKLSYGDQGVRLIPVHALENILGYTVLPQKDVGGCL
jgi:hypothetical protein